MTDHGGRTVDTGYSWFVLLAAIWVCILFSMNLVSYGIFLPEFVDYFRVTKASATVPGSLSVGISGLIGIVLGPLVKRFGSRVVVVGGSLLTGVGIFAASFSPDIMFANIFYGVLPGIGTGAHGVGGIVAVLEYFDKRRSLAMGLAMTGLSVGTIASPPMIRYLIDTYGWRGALIILSGIQLNGVLVGALLRPQPIAEETTENTTESEKDTESIPWYRIILKTFDVDLLKDLKISMYIVADSLVFAAHVIPFILLPARAMAAGSDELEAATLLTIFGACSGALRPAIGCIGDRISIQRTLVHAAAGILAGSLSIIFFFFNDYVSIAIYAGLFGATSAGYITLDTTIMGDLIPLDKLATGTGLFMFCVGVTALLAPPLAGWIVDVTDDYAIPFLVFGAVQIVGGCCSIWTYILQRRQKAPEKHVEDLAIDVEV